MSNRVGNASGAGWRDCHACQGLLDAADIERGIAAVDEALNTHARLATYAEVNITGMTPRALLKDIAYGISNLSEWRRFWRVAVLTDQHWIRWIAEPRTRCSRLRSEYSPLRRAKQRCPGFPNECPEWWISSRLDA